MDVDMDNNEYSPVEQQFHTPKIQSQPSCPPTKPSPRTGLREQIKEIMLKITRLEEEVEASQATIEELSKAKTKYAERADSGEPEFWGLVTSTSQEIVPLQTQIAESKKMTNHPPCHVGEKFGGC